MYILRRKGFSLRRYQYRIVTEITSKWKLRKTENEVDGKPSRRMPSAAWRRTHRHTDNPET